MKLEQAVSLASKEDNSGSRFRRRKYGDKAEWITVTSNGALWHPDTRYGQQPHFSAEDISANDYYFEGETRNFTKDEIFEAVDKALKWDNSFVASARKAGFHDELARLLGFNG